MSKHVSRAALLAAIVGLAVAAPAHATLTLLNEFTAFGAGNAGGEVFVAMGNVNNTNPGDEIVAAHGADGQGFVAVYTQTGSLLTSFATFGLTGNPSGKIHIAVGEFDGASPKEILAGQGSKVPNGWSGTCVVADECGNGRAGIWSGAGVFSTSFACQGLSGNPSGEIYVAAGNFNTGTANDEIACGPSFKGTGRVNVYSNAGVFQNQFPTSLATNPNGEVPVGGGDYITSHAGDELATGHGRGGSSRVHIRDNLGAVVAPSPAVGCATFGAGNTLGFVNLSAGQYDGVAGDEIIAGHGPSGANIIGIFNPSTCALIDSGAAYTALENPTGEVHVGGLR
jgi:hypothetical protein